MMRHAPAIRGTTVDGGAAVLMARIVDRSGVAIRPSEVAAIEYSIFECDRSQRKWLTAVAGHERVGLRVVEVLLDYLEAGSLWTLDVAGYNFRHEINVGHAAEFPKPGAKYEIVYMFTNTVGDKVAVRFVLGVLEP